VPAKYVLDASAALAVLFEERGYRGVEPLLPDCGISVVNMAEVLSRLVLLGARVEQAMTAFQSLGVEVLPFEPQHAVQAAHMARTTRGHGLSLGDRVCLATAKIRNVPAITVDRAWRGFRLGVQIRCVR